MSASRPATDATRLQIDRIACTGHGICASLLPDAMRLDEWGYPLLTGDGTAGTAEARRAAVRLCPAMAVYLSAGTSDRLSYQRSSERANIRLPLD